MRFVRRKSDGSLELTGHFGDPDSAPRYAILSHTWLSPDDEVLLKDLKSGNAQRKVPGYKKIQFCGEQAAKDGLEYFWVDTCCIDQSKSQDVGEAVTAMFQYYRNAIRCYVYLTDVSATEDEMDSVSSRPWEAEFRSSRWFTRGWTLQELIAPASVEFYSVQGTRLGDKKSLQQCIQDITGIPHQALQGESLSSFTVAERLSWAEKRQTKRKEDRAYCLLGIFAIFMPVMYGEGDNAFIRLERAIEKKRSNKKSRRMDHLLSTLPTAPQAAFNSLENRHGSTCLPDTRVELLREAVEWVDGTDKRRIFWLSGIAGTGKSTVARTIARKYYDSGHLGASFFFSSGGGDVACADRLFTTLAWQLATEIPQAKEYICEAIMDKSDMATKSLRDQWDRLILNPLLRLSRRSSPLTIVVVIDALDECANEGDIQTIIRLLATTQSLGCIHLRIFITSRPGTPVRCGFSQIPEAERQVFFLHEILPTIVDRDLTLFFEHSFMTIREELGFAHNWPGMRTIKHLVQISCGLFIWASTACRFIREGRRLGMRRLALLLNGYNSAVGPEKQLDEIYSTVLRNSMQHGQGYQDDEKHEFYENLREVLGSIAVLFSPLSVISLANLLSLTPSDINATVADLHTILHIPPQNDRPIRIHHPTFRDFLLNKDRCKDSDFCVDEKQTHRILADKCVALMSKMLKRDICGLQSPGTLREKIDPTLIERCIPPELQYACLYWVQHYRQSGKPLHDDDQAHCFFREHFLHWLEAITLMGKISEAAAIIRLYQSLLLRDENLRQWPFVKDTRRFFLTFQSIIEQAPLQVYCSALAFIPSSNEIRHHFWSEMHPWLKRVRTVGAIASNAKDEYNYVNDIAFTPNGRQIASGSRRIARVWDVATKSPFCKFEGQRAKVSSVAISLDGEMIALGSDDTTVMVWSMRTKSIRYVLSGHTRWVNTVVFSPDGKLLASGSMDETIRVWDAKNGKEIKIFETSSSGVNSIAFSSDSSLIASGTVDQMVRLWDVARGQIRTTLYGHSGPVNSVRFSPDGKQIVSGSDDLMVKLWDTAEGTECMTLKGHLKTIWSVAFSPDGRLIASGSEDKTIKLWESSTGAPLATLLGHTSGINAVTFSPDGQLLASGSFNDEVRLWDANSGETRGKFADFEENLKSDSSLVLHQAASGLDENMDDSLSNPSTTIKKDFKAHSSTVICIAFSPDGQLVASGSYDTTIKLWTNEGTERWKLEGHSGSINHLAFSPDGYLIATASTDKTAKLWDVATGAVLYTLEGHSDNVRLLQFSPDGCLLASCSNDKTARIWNTATGAALSKLEGHEDTVNNIAFSPDNRLVASCSADTTIILWDEAIVRTASKTLRGHSDVVTSIAFSPDGNLLVSCSADKTIKFWDIAGAALGTVQGHTLPVNSAAFSRDNKLVVSCSDDETVRIWDFETKSEKAVKQIAAVVRSVSFSGDGRYIVTDRGILDIGSHAFDSPSLSLFNPHVPFVTNNWLRRDMENALWLPPEYHATSVATWNGTTVLGHSSGDVSFIHF